MTNLKLIIEFLGRRVVEIFAISTVLGVLWFLIELSFVFLVQALFSNMGLISKSDHFVTKFLPSETTSVCLFFLFFTIIRSALSATKQYYSRVGFEEFSFHQKKHILHFATANTESMMSVSQLVTLLNQNVYQASTVIMNITSFINTLVSSVLLLVAGFYTLPIQLVIGLVIIMILGIPLKFIG